MPLASISICYSKRVFCFISSYHFHFTPVVCMEMWKHDWVTPWPKRHANEENNEYYCIFRQPNKASSFTRLDRIVQIHRKSSWRYLLLLPETTQLPCFFLFSCLHVSDITTPDSPRLTHTKMAFVTLSLSNSFGDSSSAVVKWSWL